jgi:lipid II:glycine glycyltransferase (peptidoglycan interpeptide bridge formation enzyme)
MLRTLGDEGMLEFGVAEHNGDVLAMHICMSYRGVTTYVHGASTHTKKEYMAPYLLQWRGIQRSLARGDWHYDFYGVAPEGDDTHYLVSVSRFKSGFGGEVRTFLGTHDWMFSSLWYRLYRLAKRIRSL